MIKKREKINKKIVIFLAIFILITSLTGCNRLTPEEKAERERERQEYIINHTYHYPVISIFQYVGTKTNNFGAIIDQRACFSFTWLDSNGILHQTDNYSHYEYGLTKVKIGDVNEFVVYDYGDNGSCLFLTEDTLKNIKH